MVGIITGQQYVLRSYFLFFSILLKCSQKGTTVNTKELRLKRHTKCQNVRSVCNTQH